MKVIYSFCSNDVWHNNKLSEFYYGIVWMQMYNIVAHMTQCE